MKTIKSHNTNRDILIDNFNFERLKNLKIMDTGDSLYIHGYNKFLQKDYKYPLTKIILLTDEPMIDHKDRNYLNNQINNLRPCNWTQNMINRSLSKNNKSGFIGVSFHKYGKKFQASLRYKGKYYHLGSFNSAEEAARVRDKKAKELYGEFAVLNFPNEKT